MLAILAGCQSSKSMCWDKPLRPSQATIDAMSDQEVQDLLEHNEKGAALCGWKA